MLKLFLAAGFRLDIAQLKEFYEAATAPRVFISCPHEWNCPAIYVEERRGPCTCGAVERQARLDKALAVLAEASDKYRRNPQRKTGGLENRAIWNGRMVRTKNGKIMKAEHASAEEEIAELRRQLADCEEVLADKRRHQTTPRKEG
jgi:hypothetical protein